MSSRERPLGRRRALRPLSLPRWWVAGFVAFLLVVIAVVVVVVRREVPPCRDDLVDGPRDPLLTPAQMQARPDERLETLAAAVTMMGAPFGDVLAGVGYDYDQWLHVYGIDGGVLAFTKNNAPVTLLDPTTLKPRWALRPASKSIAWDASGNRFLLLDLSAHDPTRVSAYDVADGHRIWCAEVDQEHKADAPVATMFLDDGDVLTALPDDGKVALTRLSAKTGTQVWSRSYDTVDRADYLGPLTDTLVLAGGTEEYRLADQPPKTSGGPVITAVDTSNGHPVWAWTGAKESLVHVIGVADGRAIAVQRTVDGVRLFALSDDGQEDWSAKSLDLAYEASLRGGMVVTRSRAALYGYDARTGKLLWDDPLPTDRTYFPYGFSLDQMPSLDDDHVLMPTTTALVVLDVRDGTKKTYPLPVDGISTTYWPYQLLVTPDLLGVVTNTGAVVAKRD